ncbi:MAG TPA: PAS domain S-box protein [Nitrospirota bacterium]
MSKIFNIRTLIRESFGLKIFSAFVAVIVAVLTVYTVFAIVHERGEMREGLREDGDMLTGLLARDMMVWVYSENQKMLQDEADHIMSLRDVTGVSIYNLRLKALYFVNRASGTDAISVKQHNVSRLKTEQALSMAETGQAFEFLRPIVIKAAAKPDEMLYFGAEGTTEKVIGYVGITLSKDRYHQEIRRIVVRHVLVMLIFVLASGGIVYLAVRKVTSPLKQLNETAKAFARGLPVEQGPAETGDELESLASTFNDMAVACRLAEELVGESWERYHRLVELSPDAIYIQREERFLFVNTAGVKLFGAGDLPQIMGRRIADFFPEDCRENVARTLRRTEQEEISVPFFPARCLRLDGTAVDVEIAASTFQYQGTRSSLVIVRDISSRKGMQKQIQAYKKELRSMESRIEERERHLIAADLHDFVGQSLVVSLFKLAAIRKKFPATELVAPLEEIRELIGQSIQYTRSLTAELCPPVLIEVGFESAIRSLAEGIQKTHKLTVSVADDGRPKQLDENARYLLFRAVRELLMNVVKHAQASSVKICLAADERGVAVSVEDDGIGFDMTKVTAKEEGFGFFTIRQRLKRLGGDCEIESYPGFGTKVFLWSPFKNKSNNRKQRQENGRPRG